MSTQTLKHLTKLYDHLSYYNSMAPFPVYDTDYVADVKGAIENIKTTMSKVNYDELPVAACKYCKSLHITTDEVENDICMRCGSVNEIEMYSTIYEYEKATNGEGK